MKAQLTCYLLFLSVVAIAAPVVSDVKARQRYPWNGMVDIDYTITGDASGCVAEIKVEDLQNSKTYMPSKFLSTIPTTEGRHRVTWSTEAEGVTIISSNVAVTVSLVTSDSSEEKNLYCVIDLSGGPTAMSYPVTTVAAVSNVVWSEEYKTTKLVLRRLDPGGLPGSDCVITKGFYIGVFEITRQQWYLVMGKQPDQASDKNPPAETVRDFPVVWAKFSEIRGEEYGNDWPSSSRVDAESFMGRLRTRTGLMLDLPTEAQWEFACRAGTSSSFNNGGSTEVDLTQLGRYSGNKSDGRGGGQGVTSVGSYLANGWGLYDMHGNVWEICLDWYAENTVLSGNDPTGPASGSQGHSLRGGSYMEEYKTFYDYDTRGLCCSSSFRGTRYYWYSGEGNYATGLMVACPVGK